MSTITTQFVSQLVISNILPLIASSASAVASSYFTSSRETVIKTVHDIDEEHELDLLQMDRMLKLMKLVFEETPSNKEI